jgi:hypothetical protein
MSDASNVAKSLRERFGVTTEERLGKALSDLLENPLLTGAIGRAFDAREKAAQAQEVAMGALNLPSAADLERLTRRLRSVSHRLEGIEDGVDRLDRALSPAAVEARLKVIEEQLRTLIAKLDAQLGREAKPVAAASASTAGAAAARRPAKSAAARKPRAAGKAGNASKAKAVSRARAAARGKAAASGKAPTSRKAATSGKAATSAKGAPAGEAAVKAKPARG